MTIKNRHRYHGLCRGLVSVEKLNLILSMTQICGDVVKRGLHAHFVNGFGYEDTAMIYYSVSSNFYRDIKKIRNLAANYEELQDHGQVINELPPGEVPKRKLELLIDSTSMRSEKVINMLCLYFVQGKTKNEIIDNHGVTNSNFNREIKKIQSVADKYEAIRQAEINQKSDR